ncbi:Parvulin-like peptidyl-prolyl isomerase [Reinekea sp. MED297]|uniref:Chaperone SurA n=2 Tax=Reinekea TaxID=230494 RepID=A4BAJ2_9GAMM|nr:Parvulin-like peptidyl-prolyl isomerase [Reinekea sp. MED297] [Reinekea blandensis MED297]
MQTWFKSALLATSLLMSTLTYAQTLDRIAAVANDDVITELQLAQRVEAVRQQYRSNPNVLPTDDVLTRQVLDAMILESLQMQLAERGNLVIPEQQVNAAIQSIASRQNMTLDQLLAAVQSSGQSVSDFREQIRREITLNELQQQIVGRQIFISDAEVERFLKSQSGQSLQETEYQLYYKRFDVDQQAEADALVDRLNSGESLLDSPDSRDLGMRTLDQIPSIFRTLVPVLEENEAVLLPRDGVLHLAQLADKTEAASVNIEEYQLRHILIKTDQLFNAESAQALAEDLRQRVLNGESMAELADEYSQDNGSRGRGGELGWATLDNYVESFRDAARSTEEGELSDVFRSPYGFHFLRVEGQRTRDVGTDVLRNQIRNQLSQQRYSEALQRWQSELRAESFVEIRL